MFLCWKLIVETRNQINILISYSSIPIQYMHYIQSNVVFGYTIYCIPVRSTAFYHVAYELNDQWIASIIILNDSSQGFVCTCMHKIHKHIQHTTTHRILSLYGIDSKSADMKHIHMRQDTNAHILAGHFHIYVCVCVCT